MSLVAPKSLDAPEDDNDDRDGDDDDDDYDDELVVMAPLPFPAVTGAPSGPLGELSYIELHLVRQINEMKRGCPAVKGCRASPAVVFAASTTVGATSRVCRGKRGRPIKSGAAKTGSCEAQIGRPRARSGARSSGRVGGAKFSVNTPAHCCE